VAFGGGFIGLSSAQAATANKTDQTKD